MKKRRLPQLLLGALLYGMLDRAGEMRDTAAGQRLHKRHDRHHGTTTIDPGDAA